MMATEDEVKSMLRSVLQSSTRPIPVNKLEREYQLIIGSTLPFKRLGYRSLFEFLESSPDTVRVSGQENSAVVQAVTTGDTAHLTRLVNQQRKTSKPTKLPPRNLNQSRSASHHHSRGGYASNQQQRFPSQRPSRNSNTSYPPNRTHPNPQSFQPSFSNHGYEIPPRMQQPPPLNRNYAAAPTQPDNIYVHVRCGDGDRENTRTVVTSHAPIPPTEPRAPSRPESPRFPLSTRTNGSAPAPRQITSATSPPMRPIKSATPPLMRPIKSATPPPMRNKGSPRQSATPTPPPIKTVNKDKLDEWSKKRGLGSVTYKTLTTRLGDERHFITRVLVGDRSFNSYPTVSLTAADSEEEAARCALEDLDSVLREKCDELPLSHVSCIVRRVHELIQDQPNGFYTSHILDLYQTKYQERLPDSWIALLLVHDSFDVTRINEKKAIVAPRKHDYKELSNEDSGSSVCSRASSPGIPSKQFATPINHEIVLPMEPCWDVFVTNVVSTDYVYLRLFGTEYSDKYDILAEDLDMHYLSAPVELPPTVIKVNDLFAVICDSCWNRVVIQEVLDNDEFMVQFVDHGDVELRKRSELRPLAPQFWELPFQAVLCQLAGLEGLNDPETTANLTNLTLSKTLVAQVESRDDLVVILHDTSTDEDVNINRIILKMALSEVPLPEFNATVTEVGIGHVSDDGHIFVQSDFRAMQLLSSLTDMVSRNAQPAVSFSTDSLYLALDPTSNSWRRCQLLNEIRDASETKVPVVFVDYGNEEEVESSDVRRLDSGDILRTVPFQAIRCRLSGVPSTPDLEWCERTSAGLLLMASDKTSIIARVVADLSTSVPQIVAVVRDATTNVALSVNDTLNQQPELFEKKGSRSVGCDHEIECVALPAKNEMVEIHVTLAASPYNFMFQLWSGGEQFDRLEEEMQEFYTRDNGVEVAAADLRADATYAALHKESWFRVSVNFNEQLQDNECVSIYFLDYGDHSVTSLSFLRKLDQAFRRLPSQALRGKLAGIVPIYGDWQTEDSLRFKELVEERQLWAHVIDFEADGQSHRSKLVVRLVDTSDAKQDVFIDEVLVAEKRARLSDATFWERMAAADE